MTRAEIEAVPGSEKLGKHKHVGQLVRVLEIMGGFSKKGLGSLGHVFYEPDQNELNKQADQVGRGPVNDPDDLKKPWAIWQAEKIRCGQKSVTPLEAKFIWDEAKAIVGREFADLFTPESLIKTHPKYVIEKALTENIPFGGALDNPILLLHILAEVAITEPPTISTLDPDAPKMTDQGDGRSEGFEILDPLPVIHVGQRFCLDIRANRSDDHKVIVFEYANSEIARIGDNQPKLAIPMRFQIPKPHGVWVMKADNSPLVAGPALGQFGFCALTTPIGVDLDKLFGFEFDADHWTKEDMQVLCRNLRVAIAKGTPDIGIALFDYDKRPA